ncbi:amiloride-sensitive sodium channel subunit beta-like [Biomphalaria glabrata]|uniref:Amiloride-sensitive sodium channel subunit beta-like n=2 Tax=Biomphalaria TaxID=6525 RepID=A0A9W3AB88_BIOGL|nr:amiloride-sensitive sodium channel subunit beta-like [Biomphalaria glabrata]XP_055884548.1 amiloride-sensitive sodium channel subunit beta-like [Biomphalaria glabrata]
MNKKPLKDSSLIGLAEAANKDNTTTIRVLWAVLTVIAVAFMIFHLSSLFVKYRKYSKHADINIGFSDLEFPAVTVCNVNIMRKSMVKHSSKEMQQFVSKLNTKDWIAKAASTSSTTTRTTTTTTTTKAAKNIVKREADTDNTDTGNDGTDTGNDGTDTGNDGTDTGNEGTDTGDDGTDTGDDGTDTGDDGTDTGDDGTDTTYYDTYTANDYNDDYVPSSDYEENPYVDDYVVRQKIVKSFLDSFDDGFDWQQDTYEDLFYKSYSSKSWEAVSNRSTIATLLENFKDIYSNMNITQQKNVSHQVRDMFRQCSFATRTCQNSYKQTTNSDFGNCYTIEDSRYISRQSGPAGGLELILYLENDEYLPLVTSGKGAHVIIHDRNTVPLPEDEGIAISVGQQTMIALKEITISRLGGNYIECKDVDEFYRIYGVRYTRNLCQKMCLLRQIYEKCKCLDTHYNYINVLMRFVNNKTCLTETQVHCMTQIKVSFKGDDDSCDCQNPCSEKVYDAYVSSRYWPNDDMTDVLIQDVCTNKPHICSTLKNKTSAEKRKDFLKLNIYYRDLNYEEINEEPDYDTYQLMSDFGGTIGLWLGFSILSLFEIFQIFVPFLFKLLGRNLP